MELNKLIDEKLYLTKGNETIEDYTSWLNTQEKLINRLKKQGQNILEIYLMLLETTAIVVDSLKNGNKVIE